MHRWATTQLTRAHCKQAFALCALRKEPTAPLAETLPFPMRILFYFLLNVSQSGKLEPCDQWERRLATPANSHMLLHCYCYYFPYPLYFLGQDLGQWCFCHWLIMELTRVLEKKPTPWCMYMYDCAQQCHRDIFSTPACLFLNNGCPQFFILSAYH